jgi:hypothetical protein
MSLGEQRSVTRSNRLGRGGAIAILSSALLFSAAVPASAAPPVDLGGAYVLDEAGVLGGQSSSVEGALDRLFDSTGAALYVVIVERFEGSVDSLAWADESAALSGLGDRDSLLAIAVDDREYATSVGVEFPATDAQLGDAEEALVAELRDNNWADGIIAYADSLSGAIGGSGGGDAAGGGIPILPIALGVGGVGAAWFFIARARRKKNPTTAAVEKQSTAELDQTASRRLVQLDDALTTSEQELGFAEAQFGAAPTEGFRTALTQAKSLVADAFRVRRELDDENPETDEQKREALMRIITACDEADDLLEAQEEAFDALRDVEKDLPAALAAATTARDAAPAALAAAEATVKRLATEYSSAAVAIVADTPTQGRRLLELADAELAEAATKQQAGETSDAAIDVRSAQLALAQLTSATAAVERLAADLGEARAAVTAQSDDLRSGIAAAASLPESASLTGAVAAAESALSSIDATNPIAALDRIIAVDRELDAQLADAREESERRAKAEAALERTLASARSRILSATEYVSQHRGAVGAAARARLAEAEAQERIASSSRGTDPVAALDAAQRALEFAGQAMTTAENDVRAAMAPSGLVGGMSGGGGGGGVSDALIGGLIGGLLRSGGGGGGSSRPRFGSSGGRPSSSRRPSSGGSTRRSSSSSRSSGRRGGGGRF